MIAYLIVTVSIFFASLVCCYIVDHDVRSIYPQSGKLQQLWVNVLWSLGIALFWWLIVLIFIWDNFMTDEIDG